MLAFVLPVQNGSVNVDFYLLCFRGHDMSNEEEFSFVATQKLALEKDHNYSAPNGSMVCHFCTLPFFVVLYPEQGVKHSYFFLFSDKILIFQGNSYLAHFAFNFDIL